MEKGGAATGCQFCQLLPPLHAGVRRWWPERLRLVVGAAPAMRSPSRPLWALGEERVEGIARYIV